MEKQMKITEDMFQPVTDNFKEAEKISRPSISYWADVWRRLKTNKLAMFGLVLLFYYLSWQLLVRI